MATSNVYDAYEIAHAALDQILEESTDTSSQVESEVVSAKRKLNKRKDPAYAYSSECDDLEDPCKYNEKYKKYIGNIFYVRIS